MGIRLSSAELDILHERGEDALAAHFKARMSEIVAKSQTIKAAAEAKGRDLTPDEAKDIDDYLAVFEATDAKFKHLEGGGAFSNADRTPAPRQTTSDPINGTGSPAAPPRAAVSARFGDMFGSARRDPYNGAFRSLGAFALAVASGKPDTRLVTNAAMSEGTGVSAGFLVPDQFLQGILDGALASEIIRPRATVFPMSSNTLTAPGFDYEDGTDGKRAGLKLLWTAEHGTLTEQVAVARKIGFVAKKGTILVRVSSELTEDAIAFDSELSSAMQAAVSSGFDIAFMQGTGAGQPLGIMNSPALITAAAVGSQTADTIWLQNLVAMYGRMRPSAVNKAVWLAHPTTVPQLLTMTAVVKNVAGTENVGGGLAAAVTQGADGSLAIFGRPVVITEACNPIGDLGDLVFANLSAYAVAMRRDVTIERSTDAYFTTDEIGFKLRVRLDGQPKASTPTKLRDGTNTVSDFVTLAAR